MRRSWLIIAMLFTLGAQTADIPSPEQKISPGAREAAAQLAKAMGTEELMLQTMELMKNQIAAAINKTRPPADGRRAVDEIIMPEIRKHSSEMTDLIVDIWASHFNLDELEQLRAYYATPLGQKSLHELPLIMAEARQVGTTWGQKTFMTIFKERAEELRALGVGVTK